MAIDAPAPTSRKRAHQSDQEAHSRRVRLVKAHDDHTLFRPKLPEGQSTQLQPAERKRARDAESPSTTTHIEPAPKRVCSLDSHRFDTERAIDHWRRIGYWPNEYFEPNTMTHLLARNRPASLRRRRSEAGSFTSNSTPSDQKSRDEKSTPYKDAKYEVQLELRDVYLEDPPINITPASKEWCQTLLDTVQSVPHGSLFQDRCFIKFYKSIKNRNEAKIVQDIARLIVPSAEAMYLLGAEDLVHLIESVNEGWNNAIPLFGTRPQPDYSVGFARKAFSSQQNEKLAPYVGEYPGTCQSYFMATWYMHFPFLASEVKCNSASLDVADRQNAHSMTLAVRSVVELFRLVKRHTELNGEILAFSISHDSRNVRMYGHFPVINGQSVSYYRHLISGYDLTADKGDKRWSAHKFITSVYKLWVPRHLERLCSAIDALPLKAALGPAYTERGSEASQEPSSHAKSSVDAAIPAELAGSNVEAGPPTPDTSCTEQVPSKRPRV